MAGTYPDVPGPRMAYDRDGTILVRVLHSSGTAAAFDGISTMNAETGAGVTLASGTSPSELGTIGAVLIFPEARDVVGAYHGIHLAWNNGTPTYNGMYWSPDTTNGIDGTWNFVHAPARQSETNAIAMRDNIASCSLTGVKGLAFRGTVGSAGGRLIRARVHVYGQPTVAPSNRLQIWHPTLNEEVGGAYFDWGDIARGSTVTREFRVHNPSASLTANAVDVTMEALSDTSPSNTGQHEFSVGGGAWGSTASLGNLAPGATSGAVALRRVTVGSAALSLWWTRMVASAASWS